MSCCRHFCHRPHLTSPAHTTGPLGGEGGTATTNIRKKHESGCIRQRKNVRLWHCGQYPGSSQWSSQPTWQHQAASRPTHRRTPGLHHLKCKKDLNPRRNLTRQKATKQETGGQKSHIRMLPKPFRNAKRHISQCETGRFRLQDRPFCNPKRGSLQCKIRRFGAVLGGLRGQNHCTIPPSHCVSTTSTACCGCTLVDGAFAIQDILFSNTPKMDVKETDQFNI